MWSALMNGSGLHGGGGAGGGYVPSQGWEFVPCSRMDRVDRGRGKGRSPLRRISSPPTVFSQLYDPQFIAASSAAGGEGGAGTQLEVLRGQMWPDPDPQQQQQQQTQHSRLKKKFEDLKKRHVQDKEEWMREKETLLREVADIQGGENRRILLDLKTVLDELQAEVKREEEKRSDLQLQYTRDRCAWELERAELKCRIAQLEARERAGLVSGGVQTAAGLQSKREQQGETPTLRREREEQRRLLADTHSTAMDLRCRLEHNERDWSREKAELLERFDVERKEWESQLRDMQRKIEELYCEVRAKREGTGLISRRQDNDDSAHRLSIRSTSTGSSLLSDNSRSEPLSSSSQSETIRHSPLPALGHRRNLSSSGCAVAESDNPTCFPTEGFCEFNISGQFTQSTVSHPELPDEIRSTGSWQKDSFTDSKEAVDTIELEEIFHHTPVCRVPQKNVSKEAEDKVHMSPQDSLLWAELNYGSDKKKNTTALNAALKEIARVSEELCSYQDEIRKKSGDKRNRSGSLCQPDDIEKLEIDEAPCDLSKIYDDLRALEQENWITLTPDNTWLANRGRSKSWRENTPDPDSYRETQTSLGDLSDIDAAAPPIPPRVSSRNLNTPINLDNELHIPDSPVTTVRRCHSPCILVDRKCSSPSIVRKFEAMLQENEGKVLKDGVVASCAVPANSNCNTGCCHNRWSCDASKLTGSKLSAYGTVQKSFSEVSILTAGKRSDYSPTVGNLKELQKELQSPLIAKDLPVDLLLSSLEMSPASLNQHGSKRNIMLEQKTAEFNRTLFQAEMGRAAEEQDSFMVTDVCSAGCTPLFAATSASQEGLPPRDTTPQQQSNDVTTSVINVHPEAPPSLSDSHAKIHNPELRQRRCSLEGPEAKIKQETPSDSSFQKLHTGLRDAVTVTPECPPLPSEVKHKVRTASSPSRKTQHRAATEAPFLDPLLPVNTQPGQDVDASSCKRENPCGSKPQPTRVPVPLQQPSSENKQRQMTEPKHVSPAHQSDSSRPGPRMMNDHPWKPLTLAAYPRPEGSRSNYGAVERILKNYESAAREKQNQSQQDSKSLSPKISVRKEEKVKEMDMLDMDPLPLLPTLRHTHSSHSSQIHTMHTQLSSHTTKGVREIHLTVQEDDVCSSSVQKNFSRPARPANRRLPSRWASRSPTSSSASSSPSTTPVVPPSSPLHKHTSSFTYSHAFHIETVII